MLFYFDTEFIEDGKTIDLISIGITSEDGREYYAESKECDLTKANDWVKTNVIPHLKGGAHVRERAHIATDIVAFVGAHPEFWAYYASYDWVALCQLYGRMIELPDTWPKYCNDLKQLAVSLGSPELPKQVGTEHHALEDARWNKHVHRFLLSIKRQQR